MGVLFSLPKISTHLILPETHLKHGYIRLEFCPLRDIMGDGCQAEQG
jgi:hypothetical protein